MKSQAHSTKTRNNTLTLKWWRLFLNRTPLVIYAAIGIFSFIAAKITHKNKLLGNRQLTLVRFHISKMPIYSFHRNDFLRYFYCAIILYALVRNGLGRSDYPVVFRRSGEIDLFVRASSNPSQLILIFLFSILVIAYGILTISKKSQLFLFW